MRLILEPRGGYQPNPRQPSRPTIPRHPRNPLVLEVTPDDGHFKNREPLKSPPPIHNSEPKSPTSIFTHKMRKKGSLFAELLRGAKDDSEENVPTGDGDSSPSPEIEENEEEPLADNGGHDRDHINQVDPTSSLSTSSSFPISQSTPTGHTLLPNPTTTETSMTPPLSGIAKLASALNLEPSRLEISLLALGILVLVVQMGALIWIGVRRRRRSAQWHQKERQQRVSEDQGQGQDQDAAANHSRFSSTARLLLKAPFLGSSSGGQGLGTVGMMPAFLKTHTAGQGISSSWEGIKARFGGRGVETKENMGADSTAGKNQCLFDEVFPPPSSSTCSVRNALDLQQESGSRYLPEQEDNPLGGGGTGYHHHNLVLGPPTVIPVSIPPAPKSSSSPTMASLSSTASEFIETVRRKSSTILAETIMPPVHVQVEVLTEIGRRVSATLQSTVGSVIPRGTRERQGTGNENDHKKNDDDGGGYRYSQSQYHGYGSASSGDDELSSSSNEGSGSYTPPEERYRTDLEVGRLPSSIFNNPRGSRGDEASAMTSGATRRFSLNGSIPTGGSPASSLRGSEGLVRRTNIHHRPPHRHHNKRVSFVEGLVSPSSSSAGESSSRGRLGGNRRHSSFTFLQRGSAASRRPGDEEMGGTVGEGREEDDEHEMMGSGEGGIEREQMVFHLV